MAKPSPDTLYSRKLFQKSILKCLTRRSSHRAACLRDTYPSRLHERQAVRGPSLHQAHSAKGSRGVTQRFARGPRHARRPVTAWPMAGHSTRRGAQRPAESSVGLIDALSLLRNIPAFAGERARPPPVEGKTRATHRPHTQTRARPGAVLCAQQWERGTDPTGCPSTRTTAKTTGETEACTPGEGVAGTKERALSGRPRGLLLGADRRPGLHHRPHCDFLHPMPEGTAPRKAHAVPAEEGTASRDPRLLDCTGPRKHRPAPGISWEWAPEQGRPWKVLAPLTRRRRLEAETRFRVPLLAGARRWLICGCHFLSGSPDRMKRGRSGHGRVTRLQSFGRCACPRGVRGEVGHRRQHR